MHYRNFYLMFFLLPVAFFLVLYFIDLGIAVLSWVVLMALFALNQSIISVLFQSKTEITFFKDKISIAILKKAVFSSDVIDVIPMKEIFSYRGYDYSSNYEKKSFCARFRMNSGEVITLVLKPMKGSHQFDEIELAFNKTVEDYNKVMPRITDRIIKGPSWYARKAGIITSVLLTVLLIFAWVYWNSDIKAFPVLTTIIFFVYQVFFITSLASYHKRRYIKEGPFISSIFRKDNR